MKQTGLWLATLVFTLVMTWVVFPRVAHAHGLTRDEASLGWEESPEEDPPAAGFAHVDMSNGADEDEDDPIADGLAAGSSDETRVAAANRAEHLALALPFVRTSQSFGFPHDKVPR